MASWYERLEQAREDNDKQLQRYIKGIIVSIAGKLAETGKQWVSSPGEPQYGPWASWRQINRDGTESRYRNIAWYTQREEISPESDTSMPAIASFITSHARVRMLHLMRIAGRENVFYIDTDGILCNEEAYHALLGSGEIDAAMPGYFRLLDTAKDTLIHGIKHYRHSGKWVIAGVPRSRGNVGQREGSYWQQSRGIDSCRTGTAPINRQQLINCGRNSPYQHGVVWANGVVEPWRFTDGSTVAV
jgi:hypothetical protein